MQANCTQAPPAELPLRDFALPQCVLQVAACVTPFRFNFPDAAAWLHALHIYSAPNPAGAEASELLTFRGVRSDFWLTAVNLQGGGGLVRGIQADSTRTFIWGALAKPARRVPTTPLATMRHFTGRGPACR